MGSKDKKKKRSLFIRIDMRDDIHLELDEEDNCLQLRNSEGEISNKHLVSIGESYNRAGKGPKVLRELKNSTGGLISLKPSQIVYDRFLAIDTSYKPFGENFMCVTSCLILNQDVPEDGRFMKGDRVEVYHGPSLIFLAEPNSKPERYGWMKMLEGFLKSNFHKNDSTYGVIVDSDLEDLQKINAQEEPIIDSFFVPDNVELIYASADAGKESLMNKLIRATDHVAKSPLNLL